MAAGMIIHGSQRVEVKNSRFEGGDVGIAARDSSFIAENVSFENVRQPFDISGSSAVVSGTRIRQNREIASKSQVGWTPQGPALPAECDRCGTVFPSRHYGIKTSEFYGRANKDVCPVCYNENAKLADGLFDLTTEAIGIVQNIARDPVTLEQFNAVAEKVRSGSIHPLQALAEFREKSTEIDTLLQRAGNNSMSFTGGLNKHGINAGFFIQVFLALLLFYSPALNQDGEDNAKLQSIHEQCLYTANELIKEQIRLMAESDDVPATVPNQKDEPGTTDPAKGGEESQP